ncbi:phosphotransferase [Candidatus Dojkabacteria bacterium]|nr:phosphotransferase [Candidatus Dojkabacteria bacterium]
MSTKKKQEKNQNKGTSILKSRYPEAKNIRNIANGRHSGVVYFEDNGLAYVLKVAPRWSPIHNEVYYLSKGNEIGITPKVIESDSGKNYIVMEYVDGTNEWEHYSKEIILELYKSFGEIAAKQHSIEVEGCGRITENGFKFPNTSDYLKSQLDWILNSLEVVEDLSLSIKEQKFLLYFAKNFDSSEKVLLHGDLFLFNTINNREKAIKLIDPGIVRGGSRLVDIGIVHNSKYIYDDGEEYFSAFKDGYSANSDISVDWGSEQLLFMSILWALVIQRFYFDLDKSEYKSRLEQRYESIRTRINSLMNS